MIDGKSCLLLFVQRFLLTVESWQNLSTGLPEDFIDANDRVARENAAREAVKKNAANRARQARLRRRLHNEEQLRLKREERLRREHEESVRVGREQERYNSEYVGGQHIGVTTDGFAGTQNPHLNMDPSGNPTSPPNSIHRIGGGGFNPAQNQQTRQPIHASTLNPQAATFEPNVIGGFDLDSFFQIAQPSQAYPGSMTYQHMEFPLPPLYQYPIVNYPVNPSQPAASNFAEANSRPDNFSSGHILPSQPITSSFADGRTRPDSFPSGPIVRSQPITGNFADSQTHPDIFPSGAAQPDFRDFRNVNSYVGNYPAGMNQLGIGNVYNPMVSSSITGHHCTPNDEGECESCARIFW